MLLFLRAYLQFKYEPCVQDIIFRTIVSCTLRTFGSDPCELMSPHRHLFYDLIPFCVLTTQVSQRIPRHRDVIGSLQASQRRFSHCMYVSLLSLVVPWCGCVWHEAHWMCVFSDIRRACLYSEGFILVIVGLLELLTPHHVGRFCAE